MWSRVGGRCAAQGRAFAAWPARPACRRPAHMCQLRQLALWLVVEHAAVQAVAGRLPPRIVVQHDDGWPAGVLQQPAQQLLKVAALWRSELRLAPLVDRKLQRHCSGVGGTASWRQPGPTAHRHQGTSRQRGGEPGHHMHDCTCMTAHVTVGRQLHAHGCFKPPGDQQQSPKSTSCNMW